MSKPPENLSPASLPSAEPDAFDAPEFEPAHPRFRFDGWTPQRQAHFIEALAESGCVADACRTVGMSERSAYALRARADAISFRNAWEAALDYSMRRLTDAVLSRAIHGVAVPVFFQGEQIGEKRHYDERLAMFLLRHRDPVRYGNWRNRTEWRGHPESHSLTLLEAQVALHEDSKVTPGELPNRWGKRLLDMVKGLLRMEQIVREGGPVEGDLA